MVPQNLSNNTEVCFQVDIEEIEERCSSVPSLQMHKFLDQICEDCYRLYRDIEIYRMCRYGISVFTYATSSLNLKGFEF